MKLLDDYNKIKQEIYDYFNYNEDWHVYPIEDKREFYWGICDGNLVFHETKDVLFNGKGDYYSNDIVSDRFTGKSTYVGDEYTMVIVDTRTDGNKFLQILSNDKKIDVNQEMLEF